MINTTLSQLYRQFNPQYDRDVDRLELRASSDSGPLRVKTRQAFFTNMTSREAQQENARTLIRSFLGNSIREAQPRASAQEVSQHLGGIWGDVMGVRSAIRVHHVRDLRNAVTALAHAHPPPHAPAQPALDPDQDISHNTRQLWLTSRQGPSRVLGASSFAAAAAPDTTPPAQLSPAPAPRPPAARQQAPAQSTGVQDARSRLARENDKIAALSHLKKIYSPAAVHRLHAADQGYFHDRLRNLVECADKYLPELMRGRAQDHAILEAAAGHILRSEELRLDSRAALYKALVECDVGAAQRLFRALPPGEASVLSKSLVIEHSQPRTLADTPRASPPSGQNNHLQKQTPG
jgi:hypothetical protein